MRSFQNLRFDYQRFINGSYAKYGGQYNKLSQTGTYRANITEQVYISDNINKLFKGALFKLVSGKYLPAGRWYNAAVFPGGLPDAQYLKSYGNTQAYSVWNQYRNTMRIFEASLTGIDSDLYRNLPTLIHQYRFADSNPNVDNKFFMLVNFSMNFYLCEWTATLVEVYDSAAGKRYDDLYELKFEQA